MNQNFIFAFILFAIFSIVNATPLQLDKRGTKFNACEDLTPLTVKLSPDPIEPGKTVTFDISGNLPPIPEDKEETPSLTIDFSTPDLFGWIVELERSICSDVKCPVKKVTPFSTSVTLTMPRNLPPKYNIFVQVLDIPSADNRFACAKASIGL